MNDSDKKTRERINAMNAVPGSSIDKNAAWQKLQLRMDSHPAARNSRKYYYGIAAAVAVVLSGIAALMPQQEKQNISPDVISATAPITTPATTALPQAKKKTVASQPARALVKTERSISKKEQHVPVRTITEVIPNPVVESITKAEEVVAKGTGQEKIKLVHISEVAEETPQYMPRSRGGFITITQFKYKNTNSEPEAGTPATGGWFK